MSAVFSPCRTWRYTLTREWGERHQDVQMIPTGVGVAVKPLRVEPLSTVTFIGLNPSTADETTDDPTVRRCVGYAKRWGFERMVMLNAFAFRATNPQRLRQAENPVGPENDEYLVREAKLADLVVCCWGNHALWHPHPNTTLTRQEDVYDLLRESGVKLYALGTTKLGAPKHPLYLRADLVPEPWNWDLR